MALLKTVTRLFNSNFFVNRSISLSRNIFNYNTKLCKCPKTTVSPKRSFFIFRKPTPEKYRIKDNIPDEYSLIYRNTMDKYLLAAQIISAITAGTVFLVVINQDAYNEPIPFQWKENPKHIENEFIIYIAAFVGMCVSIQAIIHKMPIRIYNLPEQKKYIFLFYRSIPLSTRRVTCKVKDIEKLNETGILPWKNSKYEIKNKQQIIMLDNFFRRPADLNVMLGYQKPED